MAGDGPENPVLIYLRRLDAKIDDVREVKERLGALEEGQARLSRRMDRLDSRLDRIERRLDLADAPVG